MHILFYTLVDTSKRLESNLHLCSQETRQCISIATALEITLHGGFSSLLEMEPLVINLTCVEETHYQLG